MNDEMIEMMKRMIRTDLEKNDLDITEKALEECILGRGDPYISVSDTA